MKQAFLALTAAAAVALTHSSVLAKPANSKKDAENAIATKMIEQILNSIEMAAIDVNINKMSFSGTKDEKSGETKKEVKVEDANLTAMVSFGSNWSVDLMTPKENTPTNANIKKLYPKLDANASPLTLAVKIQKSEDLATIESIFYSDYDKTVGKWEPRPMVVTMSNKMNKSLYTVRFHALTAEARVNPKNPNVQVVSGSCKADKILYDFTTQQNKRVEVKCEFKGVLTDKGYDIDLTWAGK